MKPKGLCSCLTDLRKILINPKPVKSICRGILVLIGFPANIHLFKDNNRNTRKRCECSKLTVKTPEQHISHLFIVFYCLL